MRLKTMLVLGASLAMIGSLSACGGDSSSNSPTPTPTPTASSTSIEAKISPAFAAIFDASASGEPVDPNDQSVPPLAPASEPVDF